jgi:hypothetical protein
MNQTLFLLPLFFAFVAAEAQELPTLNSLRFEFDVKRAELNNPIVELQTKYEEYLGQLLEEVKGAGNLENVLAVKAEIEGYKEGKSKAADGGFPKLKRLQDTYSEEKARRVAMMNEKLGFVVESHKAKLEALQKALTKENRLDEALAVKAERDSLAEVPKVVAPDSANQGLGGKLPPGAAPVVALTDPSKKSALAKVKKVDGDLEWGIMKENALIHPDRDHAWVEVPVELDGIQFTKLGIHAGILNFEVIEPGLVFIAVSTRFPQNSGEGEGWEKLAKNDKMLEKDGWRRLRELEGFRTTDPANKNSYMVFYRKCEKGESYSIRTEHYTPPVLLMRQ